MVDEFILKRYFEELDRRLHKKVMKDITIEIKPDTTRRKENQDKYINVEFSYKDSMFWKCYYDLRDILEYGQNIHFESDSKDAAMALKNIIFDKYCKDLEE